MDSAQKQVFSTFEIAALLAAAPSTVIFWINSGKLKAFKTPGKHRRVMRGDLLEFIQSYKMPIPHELENTPKKILIVDDDLIIINQLLGYIKSLNIDFRVLTAKDGFSAGEMVADHLPELVVLDIFLPGLDGVEVCKKIRSSPFTSHIKILAITGRAKKDIIKDMLSAGANSVLAKPIQKSVFQERVLELLEIRSELLSAGTLPLVRQAHHDERSRSTTAT